MRPSQDRATDSAGQRPRAPRLRRRIRELKSVPVLPSMVTLGNLYFGFLAMAKVADAGRMHGAVVSPAVLALFETAALLVFLAMVFDGLDGAVARLTNQTSAFGAQLDSLSDLVTFGVAPAFIAKILIDYHAGADKLLPTHPKLYYVAAAIYVLCAAMRLARFNVEVESPDAEDHREFAGLPSPAAAAVICAVIAFFAMRHDKATISGKLLTPEVYDQIVVAMPFALVVLGLLMVSRFPYPHLVAALIRGRHSFPFLATLVVVVFVAAIEWQLALVALTLLYVASGLLIGLFRLLTRGAMSDPRDDADDPDDDGTHGYPDPKLN